MKTSAAVQPRDRGRYAGAERFNVEDLPLIPAQAAALALRTPQHPLVLVWADPAGRVAECVAILEATGRDLVRISVLGVQPTSARVIRYRVAHGAMRPLWFCPSCTRKVRHLFVGFKPNTSTLTVGCRDRACLGLLHRVQGGAQAPKTLLRTLAGIEPDVALPRDLRVPDVMTTAPRKDLRRFRNLSIAAAPDGSPSRVIG